MVKCRDGKKHVMVRGYQKRTGQVISKHERSCPTKKPEATNEEYICCVCGEAHSSEDMYEIPVKGEIKTICNGCADTIHGLI
jgi:hypothetical protein